MTSAIPPAHSCVLIVDGDEDSREAYAAFLQLAGLKTLAVADADDVIELASTSKIDVMVTELRSSGAIDGFEVMRRLRTDDRTRRIPIIVLTAIEDERYRSRAEAVGCDAFLTKSRASPAALACEIRLLIAERVANPDRAGSSKAQATRHILSEQRRKHAIEPVDR